MYSGDSIAHEWQVSQRKRFAGIDYLDFPIGYGINRLPWEDAFTRVQEYLNRGRVVFVHCKNGRDRSGFVLYAFLRLQCRFTHSDAVASLSGRVRAQDFPSDRFAREILWINSAMHF